jgi:hypothetical protein
VAWMIRAFLPDGSHKDHGPFATKAEAVDKKIALMTKTKDDDTEYYIVPNMKRRNK